MLYNEDIELTAAENRDTVFDNKSPLMMEGQFMQFKRINRDDSTKPTTSLNLDIDLFENNTGIPAINPRETIFITGSGISVDLPSGLPAGSRLTDAYLDAALGKKYADEFRKVWTTYFPAIQKSVHDNDWYYQENTKDFWSRPRLEFIIGELDKMDRCFQAVSFQRQENREHYKRKSALAALRHFAEIKPNRCHYWMARYAQAGSKMITANFDTGIEKALGRADERPGYTYGIRSLGGVLHYHGIAGDENVSATLKSISRPLSEAFKKRIKGWFQKGYNVIFLGYGAVDVFDVKPLFEEMADEHYPGKAIYVRHCDNAEAAKKAIEEERKYQYLLSPFDQQIVCFGPTQRFLTILSSNSGIQSPKKRKEGKKISKAWSDTQDELSRLADEKSEKYYHFVNLIRLCQQLYINPGRIERNWVQMAESMVNSWKKDGPDTISHLASANGPVANSIISSLTEDVWKNVNYDETMAPLREIVNQQRKKFKGPLTPFLAEGMPLPPDACIQKCVEETCHILDQDKHDRHSLGMQISTVFYLCGNRPKELIEDYQKTHEKGIKEKLLFHLSQVDILLQKSPYLFLYRTYYLSLCRIHNLINALFSDAGYDTQTHCFGDIDREWDICMQVPDLDDAEHTITNRIHQYTILCSRGIYINEAKKKELIRIREKFLELREQY